MKLNKTALALVIVLCGAFATESAFAWGRARVGVGFYFGGPIGYPYYYYPPPYYYPPYYPPYYPSALMVPPQPAAYVEQGGQPAQSAPAQSAPQPASYWYYCADTQAYYPYVSSCNSGWQRVSPQPRS